MTTGPPNFSAPSPGRVRAAGARTSSRFLPSFVLATTYNVLVAGSITGVPVIPISGGISQLAGVAVGTVVMPAPGLMKLRATAGPPEPSASNA